MSAGYSARWWAMATMWEFDRSAGSSYAAAQPVGRGCGRKSHHPLQCLPSAGPSRCRASLAAGVRNGMRDTMLTELASRQTTVRRFLEEYRSWICSKLGCRIEEAVLLELDFPMVQVAARELLSGVRLCSDDSRTIRALGK